MGPVFVISPFELPENGRTSIESSVRIQRRRMNVFRILQS
jgi:hypothetical protein